MLIFPKDPGLSVNIYYPVPTSYRVSPIFGILGGSAERRHSKSADPWSQRLEGISETWCDCHWSKIVSFLSRFLSMQNENSESNLFETACGMILGRYVSQLRLGELSPWGLMHHVLALIIGLLGDPAAKRYRSAQAPS